MIAWRKAPRRLAAATTLTLALLGAGVVVPAGGGVDARPPHGWGPASLPGGGGEPAESRRPCSG